MLISKKKKKKKKWSGFIKKLEQKEIVKNK